MYSQIEESTVETCYDEALLKTADGWEYQDSYSIYFRKTEPSSCFISGGSLLEGVDTVNNKVTIGGQDILMPDDAYTIRFWNNIKQAYGYLTLDDFNQRFIQASADGDIIGLYSNHEIKETDDNWQFVSTSLTFRFLASHSKISGRVDSIDTATKAVVIDGIEVRLNEDTAIMLDGVYVSLNDLAGVLQTAEIATGTDADRDNLLYIEEINETFMFTSPTIRFYTTAQPTQAFSWNV